MEIFENFFADLRDVGYIVNKDSNSITLIYADNIILHIFCPNGKHTYYVMSDPLNIDEVLDEQEIMLKIDEYRAKCYSLADGIPRGI
jgi:hypothetical protein